MTQHNEVVEQQRKKIAQEEDNNKVFSWYFQKSESSHYREVKYKSGRVVTTDLSGKDEIR
jgi:hypothetical protein